VSAAAMASSSRMRSGVSGTGRQSRMTILRIVIRLFLHLRA